MMSSEDKEGAAADGLLKDDVKPKPDDSESSGSAGKISPPWRSLMYDYTQETTMHGIRYITLPAVLTRRLSWVLFMLGACALFVWAFSSKILFLMSNPKSVNVEVNYEKELQFPSVTLCNENRYRLTPLFESGLYDLMVNTDLKKHTVEFDVCTEDQYLFYEDICELPDAFKTSSVFINITTRSVCRHLCSHVYPDMCSGVLYRRDSKSCVLTPFTGNTFGDKRLCEASKFEFYRRRRCLAIGDTSCDFENGLCDLEHDYGADERWHVVTGFGHTPNYDNTLHAEAGHYLLVKYSKEDDRKARIMTPFLNTTGLCVQLFYWAKGTRPPILSVILMNEELKEKTIMTSSDTFDVAGWSGFTKELPRGIFRIVLEATRQGMGGVAIDDFRVKNCKKKDQCLRTRYGYDYLGTDTRDGTCQIVASARVATLYRKYYDRVPEKYTPLEIGMYCRNVPGLGWDRPKCYVKDDIKEWYHLAAKPCNVQFCECSLGKFRCGDGFCIPKELTCNGEDDCGDNSDELKPCDDRRTIDCSFKNKFMCGYFRSKNRADVPDWSRHKGPGFSIKTSPSAASSGSTLDFYMLLDSRRFIVGNMAFLITPPVYLDEHKKITFMHSQKFASKDRIAKLDVYITNEIGFAEHFVTDVSPQRKWAKFEIGINDIKPDHYRIVFRATCGKPYESDIALDSIRIIDAPEMKKWDRHYLKSESIINEEMPGSCVVDGHTCMLMTFGSNKYYEWTTQPEEQIFAMRDSECESHYYTKEGHIFSPGYPNNYTHSIQCFYYIHGTPGDTVLVEIDFIDIEKSDGCKFDRLVLQAQDQHTDTNQTATTYCGYEENIVHRFMIDDQGILTIKFKTDGSVARQGFLLKFDLPSFSHEGQVLVLRNTFPGPFPSQFKEHAFLYTESIPSAEYCMVADMAVRTHIKVELWQTDGGILIRDRVFDSLTSLMPEFQTYKFTIEPSGSAQIFRLVILAYGDDADKTVLALKSLALFSGKCKQKSTDIFEYCNFMNDDCDFIDNSPQSPPNRWHRMVTNPEVNTTGDVTHHMQLNLHGESQKGFIISPFFQVDQDACVMTTYSLGTWDVEQKPKLARDNLSGRKLPIVLCIVVSYHEGEAFDCLHAMTVKGKVQLMVSAGNASIQVEVYGSKMIYNGLFVRLEGVSVTPGICNEERQSSVECDFDDWYACGYRYRDGTAWDVHLESGYLKFINEKQEGKDGSLLSSETHVIKESTELIIHWEATHGHLELYTLDRVRYAFEYFLFSINKTNHQIQKYKTVTCLPTGKYGLYIWIENIPSHDSYIGIDKIEFGQNCETPFHSKDLESLNCPFNKNLCDYIPYTSSMLDSWRVEDEERAMLAHDQERPSNDLYRTHKGTLTSPIVVSSSNTTLCLRLDVQMYNCPLKVAFIDKSSGKKERRTIYNLEHGYKSLEDHLPSLLFIEVEQSYLFQIQLLYDPCQPMKFKKGRNTYPMIYDVNVTDGNCKVSSQPCTFHDYRNCVFIHSISGHTGVGWAWRTTTNHVPEMITCVKTEDSAFYSRVPDLDDIQECMELKLQIDKSQTDIRVSFLNDMKEEIHSDVLQSCEQKKSIRQTMRVTIPRSAVYYKVAAIPRKREEVTRCVNLFDITFTNCTTCASDNLCDNTGVNHALTRIFDEIPVHHGEGYLIVLSDIGDQTQDKLEKNLGHRKNQTLQNCIWNHNSCSNISIEENLYDLGQCITINGDGKAIIDMTGAEHGLRLTLNIEQYEHVRGFGQNAGMKVHLHSNVNLPNVNDQGFAVSPNSHAHASCKYARSQSLGQPYGNCSMKELKYYTGPYSKLRCVRECEMEDMMKRCGCRQPFMKGPGDVCTISQFLNCTDFNSDGNVAEVEVECECPDNCTIISHSVELSSGQISGLISDKLLQAHKDAIDEDYRTAVETRHRVDEEEMFTIVTLLRNTVNSLDGMVKFMNDKFTFRKQAKLGKVRSAVNEISKFVHSQLELIPGELELASEFYYNTIEHNIKEAIEAYLRSVRLMKLYDSMTSLKGSSNDSQDIAQLENMQYQFENAVIMFRDSFEILVSIDKQTDINNQPNNVPLPTSRELFGREHTDYCRLMFHRQWDYNRFNYLFIRVFLNCTRGSESEQNACAWHHIKESAPYENYRYKTMIFWWREYVGGEIPIYINDTISKKPLSFVKQLFEGASKKFEMCYKTYQNFLDEAQSTFSEFHTDSFNKEFSVQKEILKVEEFHTHVSSLFENYLSDKRHKSDLANAFLSTGASQRLIHILADISETCIRRLQVLEFAITAEEEKLSKMIIDGFQIVSKLFTFVPNYTNLTNMVRKSAIWKKPSVNLGSSHLIVFGRNEEDVEIRVWPKHQSISSFMEGSGEALLRQALADMFGDIRNILYSLTTSLHENVNDVTTNMQAISQYLYRYETKLALDDKFVRDNFLKMDIYFGELKYENVEQSRAYDVLTLFSDMGGLMGLLLGGSIITILEVLDLLIYNLLRKCAENHGK